MAYYGEEYNGKDVYYPEGFNINMVNQDQRLLVYQKAFNEISVNNKVVCDLGAGTGLLGLEALRQGATHLYLVEMVPESIQPLKAIIDNHPLKDRITLITKDICSLESTDFNHSVDVFVSETFGSMLWNEGAVVYFNHVLGMFPNAKTIPEKLMSNINVAISDFSDSLLWPQMGDPAIVFGYKELYNGKRFQLDHTSGNKLFETRVTTQPEKQLSWTRDSFVNQCTFDISDRLEDVWIAGHSLIQYSDNVNQSWSRMGWYFKSLENCKVTIFIEDKVNPVLKVTIS
jgi:hypothetical protein